MNFCYFVFYLGIFLKILTNWVEFGCSLTRYLHFVVKIGICREDLSVRLAITAQFLLDLVFFNIRIVYFLLKMVYFWTRNGYFRARIGSYRTNLVFFSTFLLFLAIIGCFVSGIECLLPIIVYF